MDCSSIIPKIKGRIALVLAFTDPERKKYISGSGFVFGRKNLIVTCNHIIKDGDSTFVRFPGSNLINAKVVVKDEEHDLALLKFDASSQEPLPCADFSQVKEGMEVLFAGYPLDFGDPVTHQGILSTIVKDAAGITVYVIDGSVNPGNSGGPLMNAQGEVMGVVNARRREKNELLERVENMKTGAVSFHGVDIVDVYHALIANLQLGIGYAVPASYIPEHKIIDEGKNEQ